MPENHFFGEPTNAPEALPHVAGATQESVRGGGAVETAAPLKPEHDLVELSGPLHLWWCRRCGGVRYVALRHPAGSRIVPGVPAPGCDWFVSWQRVGRDGRTPWLLVGSAALAGVRDGEPRCEVPHG